MRSCYLSFLLISIVCVMPSAHALCSGYDSGCVTPRYGYGGLAKPYDPNPPRIYDSEGRYRGEYSSYRYDPDSVSNPYGRYGSRYSPDSINNPTNAWGGLQHSAVGIAAMRGWLSLMFMGLLFITGAVGMMSLLALWWSYMQVAHAFCGVLLGTIIALSSHSGRS